MAWSGEAGTFLAALVILFVPGAAAALAVRLRGFAALAAAAPLSLAMLTAAALVNIVIPFRWGVWAWGVGAVLLVAVAFGVRVVIERLITRGSIPRDSQSGCVRHELLPFLVVAVVAVFASVRLASAFGVPDNISQTFDNVYHLNAVRQMMDDGVIAPTRQLIAGFYPDLWHIVVSTAAEMSGAGVAAAVNVASIVLGAVVWPISCIWLVRTVAGPHVGATITAGALSIGLAAFPMLMLDFGVLYPNVLSISLLPSAIAVVVLVSGIGQGARPDLVTRWVLLVALVPTLALAHPSTLMAFLLPAFLIALIGFARWWRSPGSGELSPAVRWGALIALGAVFVGAVALFIVARPSRELAFWPPSTSLSTAAMQLISSGLVGRPAAWLVSAIVALGVATIVVARRWRTHWWLVTTLAGMVVLYLVCFSYPMGTLRYLLTGTWYQDIYRIAALFPAYMVPLGALSVVGATALLGRLLPDRAGPVLRSIPALVGAVGGVLILAFTQTGDALAAETRSTAAAYRQDDQSPLLADDERALLSRLPDIVPEGDVIVGNPWTGTSLSFALADRRALIPHLFEVLSPDMLVIVERLNQAHADPEVCTALNRTGTRWVLDFGTVEIHGGDHSYSGLTDLGDVVRLVDSQGEARLYEIVACP